VKALTGYDLNDAETRLRLQLALYMNTIRSSRSARRSTVVAARGNEVLV
jgi:hypothetical protein